MNTMIIEKPELQTSVQRYGWSTVTLAFWMLYVYLWLPLLTLVAWWVGVKLFNYQMIQLNGYQGLIDQLGLYSIIIVILSFSLIGWAEIDRMRFKNQLRRVDHLPLTDREIAMKLNLQERQLTQLREKESLKVHFSDKGIIFEVETMKGDKQTSIDSLVVHSGSEIYPVRQTNQNG
jgi:biofilm PGA synthesis protein PgaD